MLRRSRVFFVWDFGRAIGQSRVHAKATLPLENDLKIAPPAINLTTATRSAASCEGFRCHWRARICAFSLLGLVALTAQAQQYSIVDLGTLGGSSSSGNAINALGEVVGLSSVAGPAPATQEHAFLYSHGMMTDLGTLGAPGSSVGPPYSTIASNALGINDVGEITGAAEVTSGGPEYPFVYSNGVMTPISANGGTGYAINDAGWVTGSVGCCGGATYAFVYDGTDFQILGSPVGAYSAGYGINFSGQIAGYAGFPTGYQAFLYSPGGTFQDIGTLGPTNSGSTATAINVVGQITGETATASGAPHAFLWSGGGMEDLGYLPAYESNSYGLGINSAGQVVGWAGVLGSQAAFLYTNGKMLDLNTLSVSNPDAVKLFVATAINDNGWIVANGASGNGLGNPHAYLLIPASPVITLAFTPSGTTPPTVDTSGDYVLTLNVTNTGNATAAAVQLVSATLVASAGGKPASTATSNPLPASLNGIAPGATAQVTLTFPASAGAPGSPAALRWGLAYSTGSTSGTWRVVLP